VRKLMQSENEEKSEKRRSPGPLRLQKISGVISDQRKDWLRFGRAGRGAKESAFITG